VGIDYCTAAEGHHWQSQPYAWNWAENHRRRHRQWSKLVNRTSQLANRFDNDTTTHWFGAEFDRRRHVRQQVFVHSVGLFEDRLFGSVFGHKRRGWSCRRLRRWTVSSWLWSLLGVTVMMLDLWSKCQVSVKWLLLCTMGDCLRTGKPSRYVTYTKVYSAFHFSGVSKLSARLSGFRGRELLSSGYYLDEWLSADR